MRRLNVLVAATLAALIAAPAQAAVEVKPYGFVLGTYTENFGQSNRTDNPTMANSANKTAGASQQQTISNFSARGTRIGLKLSGGKGPLDTDLSGVIESDFNGVQDASAANQDYNSAPRIRLAYVQAAKGGHTFTFGQDWNQAFSPLNPTSLHHQMASVGTGAGNLWNRMIQLRWDADWLKGSDTDVITKAAVVRAPTTDATVVAAGSGEVAGSGDASGQPLYQALVELHQKLMGRTFIVGVSGSYLHHSYDAGLIVNGVGPNHHADDGLLSVHASLPVLDMVSVQGEAFYGRGTQSYKGLGVLAADNTAGGNSAQFARSRGGWGQVMVTPMPAVHVGAFYGVEAMERANLAATAAYRNENMMANLIWDVSPEMSLSIEGGHINTNFAGGGTGVIGSDAGHSSYVGLASQYKF